MSAIHEALRDRLEAAQWPERELDAVLHYELGPEGLRMCGPLDEFLKTSVSHRAPLYTAAIDAALNLVRRVAPHGRVMVESDHNGWGWAMVQISVNSKRAMAEAQTPALAICAALLHALVQADQSQKATG